MTLPCTAIAESLACMNARWLDADGVLVPTVPVHEAFAVALQASSRLHTHGWRYNHVVPIAHLRTMLLVEQTIPGGH
jgi:hypothetical protein